MARLRETILGKKGYGSKSFDAEGMVDVSQRESGQNGFTPSLNGYVSNAAYIRKNLIAVLVEAPSGFQYLPNPDLWVATLKSMIELHPNSIEGLNSTLTVENAEEAVGGAGEMQETATNVTRERSEPVFNWTEKYGGVFKAMLKGWIVNLIMDPNTKVPNIMTSNGEVPTELLPDFSSMTVMFIEPDPTFKRVVHAWLSTNMRPKTSGEIIGSRDLRAAGEIQELSVAFTALTQEGDGVNKLAQTYLDEMTLGGLNPSEIPAMVQEIQQDVLKADSGLQDQANAMVANKVTTP